MIHLSVIQLIKTEGTEHEEERIFGADLDFYPPYREGETLFLKDELRLSQFVVVDVHHSLRTISKNLLGSKTHPSVTVYVRKVD